MQTQGQDIFLKALMACAATLAAGCVAVAPIPATEGQQSSANGSGATLCNIEGQQQQDLSDGTTKATLTQSCEQTTLSIENLHKQHPKRCKVSMAGQGTELYIMPGETRTLTQTGPVAAGQVALSCLNDWNRTR
ncbi:hypothetical protein [Limnobacter sp.]|uniref:hypothetical protein n=1 Tax=Limnobacter sp. TaxID=2003368 RepID=UPI00351119C9